MPHVLQKDIYNASTTTSYAYLVPSVAGIADTEILSYF